MTRAKRRLLGQKVTLLVSFGNEPGRLEAGIEGVVREIVPADVKGAHNDSEDSIVVEFPQRDGPPRAVAFGVSQANEYLGQEMP